MNRLTMFERGIVQKRKGYTKQTFEIFVFFCYASLLSQERALAVVKVARKRVISVSCGGG